MLAGKWVLYVIKLFLLLASRRVTLIARLMEMIMTTRREFMKTSLASAMLGAAPSYVLASQGAANGAVDGVRRYTLMAGKAQHLFYDDPSPTDLWLYNRQTPGPLISAVKGDVLDVEFINNLDQPTTVHWHGIRNINAMDGVPGLTQAAVEPGERFHYRFPLNDAGTFWYHAHNMAWEQVARGLYGPIVVHDKPEQGGQNAGQGGASPRDVLIVADDWLMTEADQIDGDSFGNLHQWSHGGRLGNTLTINGKSRPAIAVPSEGPVRLRLINVANARILRFALSGRQAMKVICIDGSPCQPFTTGQLTLGPAQRIDVEIADCSMLKELVEVSFEEDLVAARFEPTLASETANTSPAQPMPYYPAPSPLGARVVDIHMQGGAMGNLTSAIFEGEERGLRDLAINESKLWAFNGMVGGYDVTLADVAVGEVVVLKVWNDSSWPHSMHLHGQHFWVNSTEFGEQARPLLRDTYLMQPNEKADLIFVADNPGAWLFHCHMLEHHAAGMGGVIVVS